MKTERLSLLLVALTTLTVWTSCNFKISIHSAPAEVNYVHDSLLVRAGELDKVLTYTLDNSLDLRKDRRQAMKEIQKLATKANNRFQARSMTVENYILFCNEAKYGMEQTISKLKNEPDITCEDECILQYLQTIIDTLNRILKK